MNKEELLNNLKEHEERISHELLIMDRASAEGRKEWHEGLREGLETTIIQVQKLDEPKKPVVPQFVANWIKEEKNQYDSDLLMIGFISIQSGLKNEAVDQWVNEHRDLFAKAFLAYPNIEIEKERKYYVVNKNGFAILGRSHREFEETPYPENGRLRDFYEGDPEYIFTEQEIKDYDERYWAFAEEVTDEENLEPSLEGNESTTRH